jgi:hypothetical protein
VNVHPGRQAPWTGAQLPFGYLSTQLGHSEVATSSRFYSKWIDEEGRRPPATIGPTEVCANLLANLGEPHQSLRQSPGRFTQRLRQPRPTASSLWFNWSICLLASISGGFEPEMSTTAKEG